MKQRDVASWLEADIQEALIDVCRRKLADIPFGKRHFR